LILLIQVRRRFSSPKQITAANAHMAAFEEKAAAERKIQSPIQEDVPKEVIVLVS
jgi:hypothetical protein